MQFLSIAVIINMIWSSGSTLISIFILIRCCIALLGNLCWIRSCIHTTFSFWACLAHVLVYLGRWWGSWLIPISISWLCWVRTVDTLFAILLILIFLVKVCYFILTLDIVSMWVLFWSIDFFVIRSRWPFELTILIFCCSLFIVFSS